MPLSISDSCCKYDVELLASSYKESLPMLVDFALYHCRLCKNSKFKARLVLVFELSEESKANILRKELASFNCMQSIHIVVNRSSRGFPSCLNYGLKLSSANYIMRIDTDDTCKPSRIDNQISHMEACDLDICYGWMESDSGSLLRYPKTRAGLLRCIAMGVNPIAHPSVCFRRECFEKLGYYNENLNKAEDFELWLRLLASRDLKIGCLQDSLVIYNLHRTKIKDKENALAQIKIRITYLRNSFLIIPLMAGLIVNLVRLLLPSGCLHGLRRLI